MKIIIILIDFFLLNEKNFKVIYAALLFSERTLLKRNIKFQEKENIFALLIKRVFFLFIA